MVKDITVSHNDAQISTVMIENKLNKGETEMVLEDDVVELFRFEKLPKENKMNINKNIENNSNRYNS